MISKRCRRQQNNKWEEKLLKWEFIYNKKCILKKKFKLLRRKWNIKECNAKWRARTDKNKEKWKYNTEEICFYSLCENAWLMRKFPCNKKLFVACFLYNFSELKITRKKGFYSNPFCIFPFVWQIFYVTSWCATQFTVELF